MVRNAIKATVIAACFIGMTSLATLAESAFEGVWKVKSTAGQPFEITLSSDGTAKASLRSDMVGTWNEEGQTAVIRWKTGWTTKITKEGNEYKKATYRKGQPVSGTPASTSEAEKVR